MNTNILRNELKKLFESQRLAVLATSFKGHPYTNLVAYAATDDLGTMLFATRRDTSKFRNIQSDPRASLLIDSRKNSPQDIEDAVIATALGRAGEVKDGLEKKLRLYLEKHPYMKAFTGEPDCALVEIVVERYLYTSRFEDVQELKVGAHDGGNGV